MNTRIEELFNILEIGESALIILDDFHKGNYQYQAKKILNNQGYKYYSLRKKTIDKYNRYAYLAFKN